MISSLKIAKLANLLVKDPQKLDREFAETVKFIEILNKIDTQNVKPTSQVGETANRWREDEIDVKRILPKSGPYKVKISWTN